MQFFFFFASISYEWVQVQFPVKFLSPFNLNESGIHFLYFSFYLFSAFVFKVSTASSKLPDNGSLTSVCSIQEFSNTKFLTFTHSFRKCLPKTKNYMVRFIKIVAHFLVPNSCICYLHCCFHKIPWLNKFKEAWIMPSSPSAGPSL